MNEQHSFYLNLGSNLEPEKHIPKAVTRLSEFGVVEDCSSVWETKSVGSAAPNFLNLCIHYVTPLGMEDVKERIIRPIETQMGRVRGAETGTPHAIDIDIVLFDEIPFKIETWSQAFVFVPLAELLPKFKAPSGASLSDLVKQAQGQVWMRKREDVEVKSAMAQRRDQGDPETPDGC